MVSVSSGPHIGRTYKIRQPTAERNGPNGLDNTEIGAIETQTGMIRAHLDPTSSRAPPPATIPSRPAENDNPHERDAQIGIHIGKPTTASAPGLDYGRIAEIMAETDIVHKELGIVLGEVQEVAAPCPPAQPHASSTYNGLQPGPAALVSGLIMRRRWKREEFEMAANAAGQMADGVIETVNEWAYEKFDEPLIEDDGEAIIINLELLQ
jgi:hypothetical protein